LVKEHLEDVRVDDKMDLQELEWGGIDWIDLAQDRERWPTLVTARWIRGFGKRPLGRCKSR
jgi:hypothetical protein